MRFYNQPHAAYCGVDLHATTIYVHILDDRGHTRLDKNLPARPDGFLEARRTNADPDVLKGHGVARTRFWGAAPLRSSSQRPGPPR
jgi:hypothetical protein